MDDMPSDLDQIVAKYPQLAPAFETAKQLQNIPLDEWYHKYKKPFVSLRS